MAKIFTDREQYGGANPTPRLEVDYYDIVAPTSCTISINSGAVYTTSETVTLTLSASDFPSGMSQMQFSNDGANYSTAEAYATSKSYTLSGEGLKTVYVKFKDISGNWSAPVSDTITLDTVHPTGTIEINGGAVYTSASPVTLTLSSTDSAQMQFNNEGGAWSSWEAYGTSKSWPLSAGDGVKTVYVQFKDAAGNVSTEPISAGIKVVADTGTIPAAKALDNVGDKEVALLNKAVTADFGDYLYIQEPGDGFSGIRVDKGGFAQGSFVNVAGVMNLLNGERIIQNASVTAGTAGVMPGAVLLLNKHIGGASLNDYTPGIAGLYGVNNIGLLVTVTGRLTKTESGYWFVDDGSAMPYDAVIVGIPLDVSLLSAGKKAELATSDNVVVTGICQTGSIASQTVPVVRLRQDSDIVYYR